MEEFRLKQAGRNVPPPPLLSPSAEPWEEEQEEEESGKVTWENVKVGPSPVGGHPTGVTPPHRPQGKDARECYKLWTGKKEKMGKGKGKMKNTPPLFPWIVLACPVPPPRAFTCSFIYFTEDYKPSSTGGRAKGRPAARREEGAGHFAVPSAGQCRLYLLLQPVAATPGRGQRCPMRWCTVAVRSWKGAHGTHGHRQEVGGQLEVSNPWAFPSSFTIIITN